MTDQMPPQTPEAIRQTLLDAILPHVPFDGWSEPAFRAALADAQAATGLDPALGRASCPRGAVDLALAYHALGDARMLARLRREDLSHMPFRNRIATAVRYRLEAAEEKDAVRRAATLFALPHLAADGARAVWGTADLIWTALGDRSDDVNWYTKRATLAGVYSATLLYWLGDSSPGHEDSWEFLGRRIDDVMRIEKVKGAVNANPVLRTAFAVPLWFAGRIRAPIRPQEADIPGMHPTPAEAR
jgi:ubiquinone biosynthesis protein COQ9